MPNMQRRMDALVRRDKILAIVFTVATWLVLAFVFAVATASAPAPGIVIWLAIAMVLLGALNTAAIFAMVHSFARNKTLVYQQDIENLDLARGGNRAQ